MSQAGGRRGGERERTRELGGVTNEGEGGERIEDGRANREGLIQMY